jgi:hypothetical protein
VFSPGIALNLIKETQNKTARQALEPAFRRAPPQPYSMLPLRKTFLARIWDYRVKIIAIQIVAAIPRHCRLAYSGEDDPACRARMPDMGSIVGNLCSYY